MKKIFTLTGLLIILSSVSFGQGFKFGIVAGLNQSTLGSSTPEGTQSGIIGFHAGIFTELTRGSLSIEPGLLYTSIGGKDSFVDANGAGAYGTNKYTVQYLQVPVNILYNVPVGIGKMFFGGGPYISVGLSGKTTTDDNIGSFFPPYMSSEHLVKSYAFNKSDNPDYGLNAVAGIRLRNGILFTLGYGYGFKYVFYNGGIKNNVASISIGYAFL